MEDDMQEEETLWVAYDPYAKEVLFADTYLEDVQTWAADYDPQHEGGTHVREATADEALLYQEDGLLTDPYVKLMARTVADRTNLTMVEVGKHLLKFRAPYNEWGAGAIYSRLIGPAITVLEDFVLEQRDASKNTEEV